MAGARLVYDAEANQAACSPCKQAARAEALLEAFRVWGFKLLPNSKFKGVGTTTTTTTTAAARNITYLLNETFLNDMMRDSFQFKTHALRRACCPRIRTVFRTREHQIRALCTICSTLMVGEQFVVVVVVINAAVIGFF